MLAFAIGGFWGFLVWIKRQFLDSVYATKQELREHTDELEQRLDSHEQKGIQRYIDLKDTINDNHDEIKDLIIKQIASI